MFNDENLLEQFIRLTTLTEADTGKAQGNKVITPIGSAAKTTSAPIPQLDLLGSAKNGEESKTSNSSEKKSSPTGSKILDRLKTKSEDDSKKPPEVKRATQKIRRNKEITNSIKSLQKPKDIATFLGDVLQGAVDDGAKESDVKNAVSLFSRETLKK